MLPTSGSAPNFVPQRLAWVSSWNVPCGIAEYSSFLLAQWPLQEQSITVLCDHPSPPAETPVGPNIIHADPCWVVGDEASLDPLCEAIRALAADVLIIQHQPGLISWAGLARLLELAAALALPAVVVMHNVHDLLVQPERLQFGAALAKARRVLVHTQRDKWQVAAIRLRDNVEVFPHGAIAQSSPARPARRITTSTPQVLVGAYGFMLPHKGFLELVQAVAHLRPRWPNLGLRMVTSKYPIAESDSYLQACVEAAEKLPSDRIEWHTDYLPNDTSLSLLRDCDLVVLPYLETTESASGALRNALASRAPVMVSPIAFFDEAQSAVLRADDRSVEALAHSINNALLDLDHRKKVKRNALRWLRARDWTKMSARLRALLA